MTPRRIRLLAIALLLWVGAFQVALAFGAPWGIAAYGGGHPGVLPDNLRVSSAIAALIYAVVAGMIAFDRGPSRLRRGVLSVVAALIALGTVMNAISPSLIERVLWTPTAGLLAWALWRARPPKEAP